MFLYSKIPIKLDYDSESYTICKAFKIFLQINLFYIRIELIINDNRREKYAVNGTNV